MSELVANILATFERATETMMRDGAEWYPSMHRVMREHSIVSGLSVMQCAGIYAATSINTRWSQNIVLATRAIRDGGLSGGTMRMIIDKVARIIAGEDIDTVLASDPRNYKVRSFVRNLSGDYDAVTVDRWAWRIATDFADCKRREGCTFNRKRGEYVSKHSCGKVPQGDEYITIADAYREAARLRGVTPATMQAVTWCVVRGTGE